jgi:hypothetical protein
MILEDEVLNRPYSKSSVRYWIKDDQECETELIAIETMMAPSIGEIVYVDTIMDKDWYDVRWKNSKHNYFREGVRGDFKVVSVKRYLKEIHFEHKGVLLTRTTEEFEVFVEKIDKD